MGNGAGEIHPAPARRIAQHAHQEEPPKNLNAYRITEADRLGDGGPKLKFQKNIAAIETLRQLDAEERPATPEEKATLVKYVGWGAMPQVFDVDNTDWRKEQFRLSEILSDEEHRSARATTLNAHYTAPTVIGAMYRAAERFGFKGGRVLEPACGIGHFVGLMPEDMLRRSTVTGIEIDPLTARIAKALYPDADIRAQPFEQTKLADGFYDLAISNVPFGDYTVHDPRCNNYKFSIHDYFFAAALEKVRPGGLLMFITSRGTMDKLDSTLREMLSTRTELLGAIRLPNDAFKKNAGTEVTTDIVMLRKLRPGEAPAGPAWKETAEHTNDSRRGIHHQRILRRPTGNDARSNAPRRWNVWRQRTDAGTGWSQSGGGTGSGRRDNCRRAFTRHSHTRSPSRRSKNPFPRPISSSPTPTVSTTAWSASARKMFLRPLTDMPSEMRSRIRHLIPVRDAVRDCLRSQMDGSTEEHVVETRQQLNLAYDRFVGRFGPVNLRANQRAFDGDPDLPLLLSLENYNDETKRATKATIFTERTIHHRQPVESVATPKEALLVTLNEHGCVDLDHMADLLNKPVAEFLPDLKGVIFLNPANEPMGDRRPVSLRQRAGETCPLRMQPSVTDPRFAENVEALKSVQPADLAATEIDVRLGAAWLPPEDVQQFTNEVAQHSVRRRDRPHPRARRVAYQRELGGAEARPPTRRIGALTVTRRSN